MKISKGVQLTPQKVVIYGPEGIGKSTLAAHFPAPLFLDVEGGTKLLDVARVDPAPESWTALVQTVEEINRERPAEFQTIVLDTADWAEVMCTKSVCDKAQKAGVEDFGYGKGYVYVAEEFGRLMNALTASVAAGYNVAILAHAQMRKFEQPDQMGAYDRWELKLSKKVAPMVKEWADMVLFCNYKSIILTTGKGDSTKAKAQGQGKRVIYATHHSCWDAKNRHGLPDELPMDYAAIANCIPSRPAPAPTVEPPTEKREPTVTATVTPPTVEPYQYAGPDVPTALAQLMAKDKISEEEVREMVGKAGHFPADTPWEALKKEGYVNGYIIPNWPWFVQQIESDPDRVPF